MPSDDVERRMTLVEKAFNEGKLTDKEYDEAIQDLIEEANERNMAKCHSQPAPMLDRMKKD